MIKLHNTPLTIARGTNFEGFRQHMGRRELIIKGAGLMAFAGVAGSILTKKAAATTTTTTYIATPEQTEGPYWVDEQLNRSDLQIDPTDNSVQAGFPLVLSVTISSLVNGSITPISGAIVDLWHCNAIGVYSDEPAYNPGGGTGTVVTTGKKFLRGYQVTNSRGQVRFLTIYPGWYTSRTAHIHCRVRIGGLQSPTTNFTTQFFFPDTLTDKIYQLSPYNQRTTARDTTNLTDSVFTTVDCNTSANDGTETGLTLAETTTYASGSYNVVLDLVNNTNVCGNSGGGGTPPGGTPPGGTPPGGTPPGPPPSL